MKKKLSALSPLDGRYYESTQPLQNYFSEFALFKYRLKIEIKWLCYLFKNHKQIGIQTVPSQKAQLKLTKKIETFTLEDAEIIKTIEARCKHDVKAVEYYLKDYMAEDPELKPYQEWVHFSCTSEDINNLSYALMLQDGLNQVIMPKLKTLLATFTEKAHTYAAIPMLARTHGQPATPTTLGKEFANFAYRIERHLIQLAEFPILGKFNGAVGNYNAHAIALPKIEWPTFNKKFVESLGLTWNPYTTQIEPHDYLADILNKFSNLHAVLIDASRDCWSYISLGYFDQAVKADEVGSSTMPHKVNPIDFENAEGNLSLSQNFAHFLAQRLPVSRFQRDLVDSTLMRNLGTVFGYALISYGSLLCGLHKISPNISLITKDLNDHPEVLAEAIQTIMRVHNLPLPYEQLKALTRGERFTEKKLQQFIQKLKLPTAVKNHLLKLKAAEYLGYAKKLAEKI